MAEQTFRSPGFFDNEIDLSQNQNPTLGVPAGVIGTAEKGPAFVPVTVGSFNDFKTKFGDLDSTRFGPYAVNEFLKNRSAVTYIRVLGGGSNDTSGDINRTRAQGSVKNAGFRLSSTQVATSIAPGGHKGVTQFICAAHQVSASEAFGFPIFTDNDSIGDTSANLVRATLMTTNDARFGILSHNQYGANIGNNYDSFATIGPSTAGVMAGKFKLFLSSTAGTAWANDDSQAGVKIFTCSLDPQNVDYVRNILNTDPERFYEEKNFLYGAFDVEPELANVIPTANAVALFSGSANTSDTNGAGEAYRKAYGRFDTRYQTPRTTSFISQPFGDVEYELFHFETLSDGVYANHKFKVSISALRASTDPKDEHGTFTVEVRKYDDSDFSPEIIEQFSNCSLDPKSENYVAKVIGDKKAFFNFDADTEAERRVVEEGSYPNKSQVIRIVMAEPVSRGVVPAKALPFGFQGLPTLKTSDTLTDNLVHAGTSRLAGITSTATALSSSILPPVPLTFKLTRGAVSTTSGLIGRPGSTEVVDTRIYLGVKTTALAPSSSRDSVSGIGKANLNSNVGTVPNRGLKDQAKFLGIEKMDVLVTGSGADDFNDNKFTLARFAFANQAGGSGTGLYNDTELSGTVNAHIKEAAYIRNGSPDSLQQTISMTGDLSNRITFGTLIAQTSSVTFNRFTDFLKFTNIFYGGFDGVNILDRNAARLNDKSTSLETGGGAASGFIPSGFAENQNGAGSANSGIRSYQAAINTMTDSFMVDTNILAIPGIREELVTDHAADRNRKYGMSIYLMDIEQFDDDGNRIFDDSSARPSVTKTVTSFETRAVDNNTAAAYFPNVVIDDEENNERVEVPASVAAMAALGFSDKKAFPWFAPAGFDRGSLDFVKNVDVRLTSGDRDSLYDARVNPIASFPQQGFVIFGQKTLQAAKSALDRVNVRRLLIEVKRSVAQVANSLLFEQNNANTRARFISQVTPILAGIQGQSGIDSFKVVMDDSNNTDQDIQANQLNGRIVIVPTRAIEFIAIDFVITNAGVSFE